MNPLQKLGGTVVLGAASGLLIAEGLKGLMVQLGWSLSPFWSIVIGVGGIIVLKKGL